MRSAVPSPPPRPCNRITSAEACAISAPSTRVASGRNAGLGANLRVATGPYRAIEIPRADCTMQWDCDDAGEIDKLQKYDSEPFDRPAAVIGDDELEVRTAPGKVAK